MSGDCLLAPQHAIHLISCTSPVRRTTHPCLAYDLVTDSGWPWQHLATVASRSGWYAHEEGQNRAGSGSIELAIVVSRRSWREISLWKAGDRHRERKEELNWKGPQELLIEFERHE